MRKLLTKIDIDSVFFCLIVHYALCIVNYFITFAV